MARKVQEEEHGESAPLWIISFADLVTLMLSFFVILAAGNNKNPELDPQWADIVTSLKAAFRNVTPATEKLNNPKAEFADLVRRLMALQDPKPQGRRGDADGKGIYGKHFRVTKLRDGLEVTMGGPVYFEPFSVKPTEEGERQLQEIVKVVKGHRNIIEIRGHVGEAPWPSDWNYDNVMKLAYDRADHVAAVLKNAGVDPRALRLVAVGPNEPLKRDGLQVTNPSESRRVEIIVRESLIDDYIVEQKANTTVTVPSAEAQSTASAPAVH